MLQFSTLRVVFGSKSYLVGILGIQISSAFFNNLEIKIKQK